MNIFIIGGSAAGKQAAQTIRKTNKTCNITILSEESFLPYHRPSLTLMISEELESEKFYLAPRAFYIKNKIDLYLNEKVIKVDSASKQIITTSGIYYYDKLLMATGSENFIPIPNCLEMEGVFSIKYYKDLQSVKRYASTCKNAVVIGGGLLGLEAAWHLHKLGLKVSIVELFPRILPKQLDRESASLIEQSISDQNITLALNEKISKVNGEKKVSGITLANGQVLDCDLLLFSVGARPNLSLARDIGLSTNRGILVNEYMETSAPDIYGAGDTAEFAGAIPGNWMTAVQQGTAAGKNMISPHSTSYSPAPLSTMLSAFDRKIFSIGDVGCDPEKDYECYVQNENGYTKLFFHNGKCVGGILIDNTEAAAKLMRMVREKMIQDDCIKTL